MAFWERKRWLTQYLLHKLDFIIGDTAWSEACLQHNVHITNSYI